MNDKQIKDAFSTIKVSEDKINSEVSTNIKNKSRPLKSTMPRSIALACVCLCLVGVVIYNTPSMYAFAQNTVKPWIMTITGNNDSVKQESVYIDLNNTAASKTDKKYDSMDQIEKMLGVDILESHMAYDGGKGLFRYQPSMLGDDIIGASIMNDQYVTGDLTNIKINNDSRDFSHVADVTFDKGKEYSSTLGFEISIIGQRPEGISNLEGEISDWDLSDTDIVTYRPKNIHIEATIFESMTDGGTQDSWKEKGDSMRPMTHALILYKGIEYHYKARVSVDTMKEFLDSLSEELDKNGEPVYKATSPTGWIDINDFPTKKVGNPKFNAEDELVLTGPMTYVIGKGDLVEGRYDMYALTDADGAWLMKKGQVIKNMMWFDSNQITLEKGEKVIFKKAENEKLTMNDDTYTLKNTCGSFLSGEQIDVGKYEITVKPNESGKLTKKESEYFGIIVRNIKVTEDDDSDNYIEEIQFSKDAGMKPKTFSVGSDEILEIHGDMPGAYTIELKKID